MPGEICAIKNFAGRFRVKAINLDTFWVLLQHFISVTPALLFAYLFQAWRRLGVGTKGPDEADSASHG